MAKSEHQLKDTFSFYFLSPLIFAIMLSLCINLLCVLFFIRRLPYDSDIKDIIKNRDEETTIPVLKRVKTMINKEVQEKIQSLDIITEYYKKLSSEDVLDFSSKEKMISFINEHSVNNVLLSNKEEYDKLTSRTDFSIFDYSTWFISPEQISITEQNNEELIKTLYILTNLNLVLRSFTELQSEESISPSFHMFDIFIPKHNLAFFYPFESSYDYYSIFTHNKDKEIYSKNCIDSSLSTPDYFYYQCESIYVESTQNSLKYNMPITIIPPYIHHNGQNYFTTCKTISINNNDIVICTNAQSKYMLWELNEINTMLSGYFFVMQAHSDIPLYFPGNKDNLYKNSVLRFEFDKNSKYYIDELIESKEIYKSFNNEGYHMKNEINIHYRKIPINVSIDKKETNLLNIIYLVGSNTYDENMKSFQKTLIPSLVFQFILFFILGFVLIYIVRYLIGNIALKIVNPFKMVNQTLQGLNKNKNVSYQYENTNEDNNEEEYNFAKENFSLIKKKKKKNTYVTEENLQFDEQPREVNSLLTQLISLKKLIKNTVINYDTQNILDLIFAREEFKKSKNDSGVLFCDSNIGNLSLKAKKYDKAIFHLVLSLTDTESSKLNNIESRFPKLLYAYRKYFSKLKKLSKILNKKNIFFSDFYSISSFHSLSCYKDTIDKYIESLSHGGQTLQDRKKLLIGKMEKIQFMIKYELQNTKDPKGKIIEIKNELITNKKEITDLIKTVELNDEYIKNIIELVRTNKKNILDSIDCPIYVLNQQFNYLIGKFYYTCGKMSQSLKYFFMAKSNSPYPLLDGKISKKSLRQILKIMSKLDNNNPLLFLHSTSLKEELSHMSNYKRQVAVLINTNEWYSSKELTQLVSQSKIAVMNIYDNIITSNDYFGLFLFVNSLHIEIALAKKEISNDDYIRELIEKCCDIDLIRSENEDDKKKLNLIKDSFSLQHCVNVLYEHMNKKNNDIVSIEKWIIIICDDIGVQEATNIYKDREKNSHEKIAFIRLNSRKNEGISNIRKKGIINFSHLEEIKKLMRITGKVNKDKLYQNERYEKFDQCVNAGNDI